MKIDSNILLCKEVLNNSNVFEGFLINSLQPVLFFDTQIDGNYTYFQQFGNSLFTSPWNFLQEKVENIIKIKKATHKVIQNEEIEFLLAYNEVSNLTFDFLYELAKNYSRCTFILTPQNLINTLLTAEKFTNTFKYRTKTFQIKNEECKTYNNYIFTLSIYSVDTLVTNFKNKEIDGIGISIEILNKKYVDYYKIPKVDFGYYLLCTNNYNDVICRDCVKLFLENPYDYNYIIENVKRFIIEKPNAVVKKCTNTSKSITENDEYSIKSLLDEIKHIEDHPVIPKKIPVSKIKNIVPEQEIPIKISIPEQDEPIVVSHIDSKYAYIAEDDIVAKSSIWTTESTCVNIPQIKRSVIKKKILNKNSIKNSYEYKSIDIYHENFENSFKEETYSGRIRSIFD